MNMKYRVQNTLVRLSIIQAIAEAQKDLYSDDSKVHKIYGEFLTDTLQIQKQLRDSTTEKDFNEVYKVLNKMWYKIDATPSEDPEYNSLRKGILQTISIVIEEVHAIREDHINIGNAMNKDDLLRHVTTNIPKIQYCPQCGTNSQWVSKSEDYLCAYQGCYSKKQIVPVKGLGYSVCKECGFDVVMPDQSLQNEVKVLHACQGNAQ